ncbi:N-acetylmuramoyl-L-alanine amidase [Jiella sp. MQZ13P-4]|uniref:N-acetylmuramoyl-L-alanine amidase n=1 Tax=Jiella sonneratiae TaxID=2816856 RepID=A0ABS3IYU4_9HYPH|nr:N-acetylmuramoyl-L-alanine amidase [Jiella sonneratiae]MBO0902582.1 N-acetylmuramoyl-L-alanine amidase [Jiella sonneratiae]
MTPDSPLVGELRPSPNRNERRCFGPPSILILHYTGMGTGEGAVRWLQDPASEVSCHYVVHEDGRIVQMVPEAERAWHAGQGSWQGVSDVNSLSIGIEIVNPGHAGGLPDFPPPQIDAVAGLAADIVARNAIRPERVLGHSDVAPARKQDPGEKFPWEVLAARGIGHFVPAAAIRDGRVLAEGDAGPSVLALQRRLAGYGYDVPPTGRFDDVTRCAVTAFQRHFRPARVDGIADVSTVATLDALIGALARGGRGERTA